VISFTDCFDAASLRHNDVILLQVICRVSGNNFMFQQDSALHRAQATVDRVTTCLENLEMSGNLKRQGNVRFLLTRSSAVAQRPYNASCH